MAGFQVQIVSVGAGLPEASPLLHRHGHLIDSFAKVSDVLAIQTCHTLARQEQLYVGITSGAAIAVAMQLAASDPEQIVVAIALMVPKIMKIFYIVNLLEGCAYWMYRRCMMRRMASYFEAAGIGNMTSPHMEQPLADLMRPTGLEQIVGQNHLVGSNGVLQRMVATKHIFCRRFCGDLLAQGKHQLHACSLLQWVMPMSH